MKTLYLVRHAKSSWSNPDLADFDRPLNSRGRQNAPEMGEYLKSQQILPDLIVSSPANRALTTAKEIARIIGYDPELIVENESVYHASESELLHLIRETDDSVEKLMLFGHNPGFTYFANALSNSNIDNIPTCGVAGIIIPFNSWIEIDIGVGSLTFFEYPKRLKGSVS